jgi:hypothetical protein
MRDAGCGGFPLLLDLVKNGLLAGFPPASIGDDAAAGGPDLSGALQNIPKGGALQRERITMAK